MTYNELIERAEPVKAYFFYYLTCGSFEAQIATLAPISVGDTVFYKDEEDRKRSKYTVKSIEHMTDAMSRDNLILRTFLVCEEID